MHDPTQEGEIEETEKINVVPLADLTLVLLILLMVLSPMITQSMIHVSAPKVESGGPDSPPPAKEKELAPLLIEILARGFRLNDVDVPSLDALLARIRQELPGDGGFDEKGNTIKRAVIVSADNDVSVGRVVEVLDGAKYAGAGTVSLVRHGGKKP